MVSDLGIALLPLNGLWLLRRTIPKPVGQNDCILHFSDFYFLEWPRLLRAIFSPPPRLTINALEIAPADTLAARLG